MITLLKDSFDAANKIKSVPSETFEDGYQFVTFDIESLFTNVPLNKTNIILDRILWKKLLKTNLKKRTMKKLIRLMY